MRAPLVVRAALVLLCAAGIVASLVTYRSQKRMDEGFSRVVVGNADERAADLLESSRALNPDVRVDIGLARIAFEQGRDWRPHIEPAIGREPENAGLRAAHAEYLAIEGEAAAARRAYARASELDPFRYPPRADGD
jgi:Tfp pilus assembly protein PilF